MELIDYLIEESNSPRFVELLKYKILEAIQKNLETHKLEIDSRIIDGQEILCTDIGDEHLCFTIKDPLIPFIESIDFDVQILKIHFMSEQDARGYLRESLG